VTVPQSIPFAQVRAGADVRFEPFATREFPEVSYETVFSFKTVPGGKQQPDVFVFCEAFVQALERDLEREVLRVFVVDGGEQGRLAIVYHSDFEVTCLEFTGGPNLLEWISQLEPDFDRPCCFEVSSSACGCGAFGDCDALRADPSAWVLQKAPQAFRRDEIVAEKADYFDFAGVEPRTEFDATRLTQALNRLLAERGIDPSPANPNALKEIEDAVGAPLPGDFLALYGATGGLKELFFGHDLMPAHDVQREWNAWQAIYDDWCLEDLRSQQESEGGVHPVYVSPRWVPFVDLQGGHYLAVDLGPPAGGTYGQVIVFGRDVHTKRRVAESVTALLEASATYDGTRAHELHSVFGALRF